jgi:hypothetical protein
MRTIQRAFAGAAVLAVGLSCMTLAAQAAPDEIGPVTSQSVGPRAAAAPGANTNMNTTANVPGGMTFQDNAMTRPSNMRMPTNTPRGTRATMDAWERDVTKRLNEEQLQRH